jgi:uncharacterized UBP type Zn finger protein
MNPFPRNQNNSCYLDSVLVALLYNPAAGVVATVLGGPWTSDHTRTLAADDTVLRLQDTICALARCLAGGAAGPDPTAAVQTVRALLGQCRFATNFASRVQQDASEALYALVELRHLHTGAGTREVTIAFDGVETTRRTEAASTVLSVHTWDAACSAAELLDQRSETTLETPYAVDGRLTRRLATRSVYTPAEYFVVHFDRTTSWRKRAPTDDIVLPDGRAFRLHAAVLHQGASMSAGHYRAVVRHVGGGWLLYDDLAHEHPVLPGLDQVPRLRETVVLALYARSG